MSFEETQLSISSMPLPPAHYIANFTEENIKNNGMPCPPPPPAKDETYTMFGIEYKDDDDMKLSLEAQNMKRLVPIHFDRRKELKKLNHSMLVNFLDLLDFLIENPDGNERREKIDDITVLFVNMHYLLNDARPHQARETLRVMMEMQKRQRVEAAIRFENNITQARGIVNSTCASLPTENHQDEQEYVKHAQNIVIPVAEPEPEASTYAGYERDLKMYTGEAPAKKRRVAYLIIPPKPAQPAQPDQAQLDEQMKQLIQNETLEADIDPEIVLREVSLPKPIFVSHTNIKPFEMTSTPAGNHLVIMPSSLERDNDEVLLHTVGPNLQTLCLSKLSNEQGDLKKLGTYSINGANIREIVSLKNSFGYKTNFVMVNLEKKISVFKLKLEQIDNRQPVFTLMGSMSYQDARISSVAQHASNLKRLAMAAEDRSVHFWDMTVGKCVSKLQLDKLRGMENNCTSWARLLATIKPDYLYCCDQALARVDERCPRVCESSVCLKGPSSNNASNMLSCIAPGCDENLFYVGSVSSVYCLDQRSLGKYISKSSNYRYAHDMNYPPKHLEACKIDSSEYVVLANAIPFDTRYLKIQTYKQARSQKICQRTEFLSYMTFEKFLYDVGSRDSYMNERAAACITGMATRRLVNAADGTKVEVITSNLLGEVYTQRLGGTYDDTDAVNIVKRYRATVKQRHPLQSEN